MKLKMVTAPGPTLPFATPVMLPEQLGPLKQGAAWSAETGPQVGSEGDLAAGEG